MTDFAETIADAHAAGGPGIDLGPAPVLEPDQPALRGVFGPLRRKR